ncbi:MAG: hypothetical protein ACE5HY_03005 [Candidatus Hydrothermarchaeales archaeon]
MDEKESHIFKYATIGMLIGIALGFYTIVGVPWGLALGFVAGASFGIRKDFDEGFRDE